MINYSNSKYKRNRQICHWNVLSINLSYWLLACLNYVFHSFLWNVSLFYSLYDLRALNKDDSELVFYGSYFHVLIMWPFIKLSVRILKLVIKEALVKKTQLHSLCANNEYTVCSQPSRNKESQNKDTPKHDQN